MVATTAKFGNLYEHQVRLMIERRNKIQTVFRSLDAAVESAGGHGFCTRVGEMMARRRKKALSRHGYSPVRQRKWELPWTIVKTGRFLIGITGGRLSDQNLAEILKDMKNGLSAAEFAAALHDELLALRVLSLLDLVGDSSLYYLKSMPPGERWICTSV